MQRADIAVINTVGYPEKDVTNFVTAMQTYVQWLGSAWPAVAGSTVREVPHGTSLGSMWPLTLVQNATLANSLGFHTYQQGGVPTGILEKEACDQTNWPWTLAASHELAEMLINPYENSFYTVDGVTYMEEVADPVTGQRFHMIGGVEISNFVTPLYFNQQGPLSRYDFYGTVPQPLPYVGRDGWMQFYTPSKGWDSKWGLGIALSPEALAYAQRAGNHRRNRIIQNLSSASPDTV